MSHSSPSNDPMDSGKPDRSKKNPQKPDQDPLDLSKNSLSPKMRQLTLNKGAQKFVFRYQLGQEDVLLDALIDRAADATDFDWFDAAVLSFKLTQSLIQQADDLLSEE